MPADSLKVGAIVRKINSFATDTEKDGTRGRVVEVVGPTLNQAGARWLYWIEFDGVNSRRLRAGSKVEPWETVLVS
jgi:hypothetical protein